MNLNRLKIEAACKISSDYAVGIDDGSNCIFKLDTTTGESSLLTMVPGEDIYTGRLYTTALFKNGNVYFTPFSANEIAIYDIEKNSVLKKKITVSHGYNSKKKFSGIVEYGDYLFMTPCTYPAVLRLNTITGETDYYGGWAKGEKFLFRKAPEVFDDHFYLPSTTNDLLLDFDMKNCAGTLYHTGSENGCWSACYHQGNLWLSPIKRDAVIKWNIVNHRSEKIHAFPDGLSGKDFLFTKIYSNSEGLFLIPANTNMAIKIDVENKQLMKADIPGLYGNKITQFLTEMNGYLYLFIMDNNDYKYLRLKMDDNTTDEFGFYLSDREMQRYRQTFAQKSIEQGNILRENKVVNLRDFTGALTR